LEKNVYKGLKRIHMVGIGGSGMSGIAEILLANGYEISGSDIQTNDMTKRLESLGATVFPKHEACNIKNAGLTAELVVVSSAISNDNPEILEAHSKGIPVISRGEMLAELMRIKYGIVVSGSHGKTTTSTMISQILIGTKADPTVIIGSRFDRFGGNARVGKGEFLVAESDESDGSFMRLYPAIAVVTNIDYEHLSYYGSFERMKEAFRSFVERVPFYGLVIACSDDPHTTEILKDLPKRVVTYGLNGNSQLTAQDIQFDGMKTMFNVVRKPSPTSSSMEACPMGAIRISMPGRHNILNALAAISVGLELDIPFNHMQDQLSDFSGIYRRVYIKYDQGTIAVIDDGEGMNAEGLKQAIQKHSKTNVHFVGKLEASFSYLTENLQKDTVIVTLGAGNVTKVSDWLKNYLVFERKPLASSALRGKFCIPL
jgi:UDP-N-acetylmuramate--alanine ligase